MDMGQHAIQDWPEPQLLHQVLVPGLEDRARLISSLATCEQITAGNLSLTCHPVICRALIQSKHADPVT